MNNFSSIKIIVDKGTIVIKLLKHYIERLTQCRVYFLEGELTPELYQQGIDLGGEHSIFLRFGKESCVCKNCPIKQKEQIEQAGEQPKAKWVLLDL